MRAISSMFASKTPSVFGFVSMRQATSLVGLRAQVVEVDAAVGVRADLDDLQPGHRHRRRVRPVRGVGRQHLRARLAAVLVVGRVSSTPASSPCEPALGCSDTCGSPLISPSARSQVPHQLERALRAARVLQRMQPRVAGQRRDALVQARVVLHRARAERVEAASRGRSCASTGSRSGGRSPARRPRAGAAGSRAAEARRAAARRSTCGTSSVGRDERAPARRALLEDRRALLAQRDHRWRSRRAHAATARRAPRPAGRCRPATRCSVIATSSAVVLRAARGPG